MSNATATAQRPVAPPAGPPPGTMPPPPPPPLPGQLTTPIGMVPPPTAAFQGVSWFAFVLGALTYVYAVWYAPHVSVSDRYFFYTAFLFSLFGCLSVSKAVRDKQERIPVSGLFYGLSYVAAIVPLVLVAYNLAFDSTLIDPSHRGLLGMAYALSAFAVLAIAKNERDKQAAQYRVVASYQIPPPV